MNTPQVALGVEASREDCYIIPADVIQGKKEEIMRMRAAVATSLKNLKGLRRSIAFGCTRHHTIVSAAAGCTRVV